MNPVFVRHKSARPRALYESFTGREKENMYAYSSWTYVYKFYEYYNMLPSGFGTSFTAHKKGMLQLKIRGGGDNKWP